MGKKAKSNSKSLWKQLEQDFEGVKALDSENSIFEEVTREEFETYILDPLLRSERNFGEFLNKLIEWREYLKPRSIRLYEDFHSKIKSNFENICITLARPFNESAWQELETLSEIDLNKTAILINGISTTTMSVVSSFKVLLNEFDVKVTNAQIFPFDVDSFGLPPINCKKIWNPLLWLRLEIEKAIKENGHHHETSINRVVTSLNLAPKEGHYEKLAVTSFFLEKTADNLDYSKSSDREQFMKELQSMFGTTKVDELTMVLPDILMAYSEELMERVMQVSYFIPHELFRLMFLCWQPKVLKLRLRSEACSSIEDAARIEWDDEDVFTSTTLFNCPLFERCEPICLGNEKEILGCSLIVDTNGSRLFDPIHNEKNFDTVGRDFLLIFPMQSLLIKRTVVLKSGASVKTQLKQQLDFIVNTFFYNAEEHQERAINYELTFENSKEVQLSVIKKCIPTTVNGSKIGCNFNVEQETKNFFTKFGNFPVGRHSFASFFDAPNQVIVDLKVVFND